MAPPPPATLPLPERLLQMAKSLQFCWFMGHLTLLLCTLRYTLSVFRFSTGTKMAAFSYRLGFLSAAVTYGIVVYKAYRSRVQRGVQTGSPQQQAMQLLGDENVQYLIMALIWLYSKPIWFALLPFSVYSTFHFLTYLRTNVIPTIIPPAVTSGGPTPPSSPNSAAKPQVAQHPLSEMISKFVKQNYDASMHLVSNLEIFLFFRVLLGALVFLNSWVLLACYSAFLRVRYAQSNFVKEAFASLEKKGDALVNDARVPEGVRNGWAIGKNIIRQVGDATDMKTSNGGARKTQ